MSNIKGGLHLSISLCVSMQLRTATRAQNLAKQELFQLRHRHRAFYCCTAHGKSGPINILETTCGKRTSQETITYTDDDIRDSTYVTQSIHLSLTDTTFTKTCATSQFSAPTEALPTPRDRILECVLCTLQQGSGRT